MTVVEVNGLASAVRGGGRWMSVVPSSRAVYGSSKLPTFRCACMLMRGRRLFGAEFGG